MTVLPPNLTGDLPLSRKTIPQAERILTPQDVIAAHGVVPEKEEEVNYVHNWLYSVVPVGVRQSVIQRDNTGFQYEKTEFPLAAYLTGFCRECRKAFSIQIPHGREYVETQMQVPVYGCVKPGTYR